MAFNNIVFIAFKVKNNLIRPFKNFYNKLLFIVEQVTRTLIMSFISNCKVQKNLVLAVWNTVIQFDKCSG